MSPQPTREMEAGFTVIALVRSVVLLRRSYLREIRRRFAVDIQRLTLISSQHASRNIHLGTISVKLACLLRFTRCE